MRSDPIPTIAAHSAWSGLALDNDHVYALTWTPVPHNFGPVFSVVTASKRGGRAVAVPGWGFGDGAAFAMDADAVYRS